MGRALCGGNHGANVGRCNCQCGLNQGDLGCDHDYYQVLVAGGSVGNPPAAVSAAPAATAPAPAAAGTAAGTAGPDASAAEGSWCY